MLYVPLFIYNLRWDEYESMNRRRSNLRGAEVRVVVENQVPHVMFSERFLNSLDGTPPNGGDDQHDIVPREDLGGAFIDLVDHLAADINFTATYLLRRDRRWASKGEDGKWTGMAGSVHDGKADLACAALTNIVHR